MNYNIQYSLLIVAFLFIQCADSSPTGPTLDLDPVLLEKTKIVFDSRSNGAPIDDIYTVSPDGSNLLNISNTAQYVEWVPRWSPDGSRIIFESVQILSSSGVGQLLNHKDENIGIVSMAADGSDRKKEINIGGYDPSWSPDGTRIALTSSSNIYIFHVNGDGLKQLTNNYATDDTPGWSPDGLKIVFESRRDNNYEIYTMNSDGSNQINVTYHPDYDAFPSWSPDGSKIAFTSRRDGTDRIYIMNADGANQFKITNNSFSIRSLEWSPVIN